jgi:hypothetical protein
MSKKNTKKARTNRCSKNVKHPKKIISKELSTSESP